MFLGLVVLKEVTSVNSSRIQTVKVWLVLKSAHFISFRVGQSIEVLADNYMREIVWLHGVPVIIVSDRDMRFRSQFC